MKRGFPNRRRLFIQNLENRRVLAGCLGVEAATADLITEEAAEVSTTTIAPAAAKAHGTFHDCEPPSFSKLMAGGRNRSDIHQAIRIKNRSDTAATHRQTITTLR